MEALDLTCTQQVRDLIHTLEEDNMTSDSTECNIAQLCANIDFDEEIKEFSPKKQQTPAPIIQPFSSTEKKSPEKQTSKELDKVNI